MVRITHVEADGVDVVADGHRVVCLLPRDGTATPLSRAGEGGALSDVVDWVSALLVLFLEAVMHVARRLLAEVLNFTVLVITTLLQGFVRVVGATFAFILLPFLHELLCIAGAAIFCPAGAVGRYLAIASSRAGRALHQRSIVLLASGRVLAAASGWMKRHSGQGQMPAERNTLIETRKATPERQLPTQVLPSGAHMTREPINIQNARAFTRALPIPAVIRTKG